MRFCEPADEDTFPLMVFGNKTDLTEDVKVSKEAVLAWCKEYNNVPYVETSAKQNEGVEEAFTTLISRGLVIEKSKGIHAPKRSADRKVTLKKEEEEVKKGCC